MSYLSDVIGHALLVCGLPALFFGGGWVLMKMYHSLSVLRYHREDEEHRRYMDIKRMELITPADGLYPAPRDAIMNGEIPATHMALSLAYLGNKSASTQTVVASADESIKVSADESIKVSGGSSSFSEAVSSGIIRPGGELFLGNRLSDGSPMMSTWKDLYSFIVGGFTGSGKSTTMRSLIAQLVMGGGRFAVIDPHIGHSQSIATSVEALSGSMTCRPAKEDHEIAHTLSFFGDEMERRKDLGLENEYTLVLVVDEATALLRRKSVADMLTDSLAEIASEGRKYNVFAMVGCQTLTVSSMGGTSDLRDLFPSAFVHRSKLNHARALLQGMSEASNAPNFRTGCCLFYSTDGTTEMLQVPNVTMEDIESLSTQQPVLASALSPTEEAVKNALIDGWSMNRIVREVFGIPNRGTSWNNAAEEVRKITSSLVSNLQ